MLSSCKRKKTKTINNLTDDVAANWRWTLLALFLSEASNESFTVSESSATFLEMFCEIQKEEDKKTGSWMLIDLPNKQFKRTYTGRHSQSFSIRKLHDHQRHQKRNQLVDAHFSLRNNDDHEEMESQRREWWEGMQIQTDWIQDCSHQCYFSRTKVCML